MPVVVGGLILLTPTLHHAGGDCSSVVREDGGLGLLGLVENAGNQRFLSQGVVGDLTDGLDRLGE